MNSFNQRSGLTVTLLFLLLCGVLSCGNSTEIEEPKSTDPPVNGDEITDAELLNIVQEATFQYFWDGAEPNSGMARERYHLDESTDGDIVTSGGSGFGLNYHWCRTRVYSSGRGFGPV